MQETDTYFNTSHVVVYLQQVCQPRLLFVDFNTSHVVVYPDFEEKREHAQEYFNTSHVVVYHTFFEHGISGRRAFQYISCCSLSSPIPPKLTGRIHFNTSHVVVYRRIKRN